MWNKAKVILLANNQETNSLYGYKDKSLLFNYNKDFYNKLEAEKEFTQHFHLYIINDDVIKEGWIIGLDDKPHYVTESGKYPKVILVTTNKELGFGDGTGYFEHLPQIPKSFIEQYITEYNKGNIISDVLVEVTGGYNFDTTNPPKDKTLADISLNLTINPDNTINIKTVKDSFNRDELIAFVKQAVIDCERDELDCHVNGDYQNLNKYILENL